MKSVCVIGAGPAGLVAAKTFLQKGCYSVTVFETADRVGGMWRARPGEHGDKCSPDMRTNLSRFTVAFSDLAWSSVDLSHPESVAASPLTPPIFPKAWQVGRYLARYAQKFGVETNVVYNKRIAHARPFDDFGRWEITSIDTLTQQHNTHTYDYLVVASGFFDHPMCSFDPSPKNDTENFQHSSQFRTLSALTEKAGKIVVIGGGISGSEAAAQAALQISNAKYSPGDAKSIHANSTVYHIINRPFYCLPRYLPQDSNHPASCFLPLDLVLYNLSRRGDGEISAAITTVPPQKAEKGHQFMRSTIGGNQRDIGHPALVYSKEQTQYPGYTGITETYSEFVRSGIIVPVQGWVENVNEDKQGGFVVTVKPKAPWSGVLGGDDIQIRTISDATGIIEATGYKTNLDFFDEDLRQLLDYDFSCPRIPLILSRGSVFARKVPSLAFVGFYEGPYWSVMEMQARFIVDTWTKEEQANNLHIRDDKIFQQHEAEEMRQALKARSLQVPQFWMADYVGLVEEFARQTGVKRNDSGLGNGQGPAFASRYVGGGTDKEATSVVNEVSDMIQSSFSHARFVAAAVFRGMQGIWTLQRKIDTRRFGSPCGTFIGSAHFHPRVPTDPNYSAEYLYIENGTFIMDHGASFPATRRYIYRYNEATDRVTAWFVDEDGESVTTLFNTWEFEAPCAPYLGWVAKGHHWCDPDTYRNTCEFIFQGAALRRFDITYQVEGPNKDYSHQSWYARPVVE